MSDIFIFHQAIQVFLTVWSCPPQKLVYRDSLLTVRRGAIIGLGRTKDMLTQSLCVHHLHEFLKTLTCFPELISAALMG